MQAFWGKFPAFSLQFMQFDGLPLLIHRCFCVKTTVFITQTKVPQLFDSQGTLCLRQYRIILSADTASEVRQLLSQKRR